MRTIAPPRFFWGGSLSSPPFSRVGSGRADSEGITTARNERDKGKRASPHRSQLLRVVDFECQVDDPIDLALLRRTWLAPDLERNRWIGRGNRHEGEK